jgi:uncharacterized protein YciI
MKKSFLFLTILFLLNIHSLFAGENQYFFVFLNSNPDRDSLPEAKVLELQEGHMANINKLAKEGKLITAGPVKGGGIFILIASSLKEAKEYLLTDPVIKAKRFNLEVYQMNIAEGNICSVPEESFKMVNYLLIRYEGNFSAKDKKMLLVQIDFEERNDGVAVLNYDPEKGENEIISSLFSSDKTVYIKKLWIGKGSFCE